MPPPSSRTAVLLSSRATRAREPIRSTYYPREWFAQKEATQLTLHGGNKGSVKRWKESVANEAVGRSLSPAARNELFWALDEKMKQTNAEKREKTGMFFLPYLDWSLREGCKPLLSPEHAFAVYSRVHRNHVEQLVKYTAGTPLEASPLDAVVTGTAFDATLAAVHYHACMHWNMLFFWKSIVPYGSVDVPVRLRRAIKKYFGDPEALEKLFEESAMRMVGNGFVWVCWNPVLQSLEVRTTDRYQCPRVLEVFPLIGLNLWDNVVAPGYQLNKLEYVKRFWLCIDWQWADQCWGMVVEDASQLTVDVLGRSSKADVHIFPNMPTFRDDQYLRNRERSSRADPLASKKREWEAWKILKNSTDPAVVGPGMNAAEHQDQETEFQWRAAQHYHILATHASLSSAYPTQYAAWDQTSRWWGQLNARAELRRGQVFPPKSGIMWPEEARTELLQLDAEEEDDVEDWNEETPMPWKEMREKWFHSNTHEREFDFWRKRVLRNVDKQGLYYGAVMGSG